MTHLAQFWADRVATHGHSGWANQAIYAYDQEERLAIVADAIDRLGVPGGQALDFGSGSGDFSRMLLARGFSVCGYDPYVVPAVSSPRFSYARSLAAIDARGKMDLVLAVTALDHILDVDELKQVLRKIREWLRDGSAFVLLEYALDTEAEVPPGKNHYQCFRLFSDWTALLTENRFRMERVQPVPHPIQSPSMGFQNYGGKLLPRLRGRWTRMPFGRLVVDPILRRRARRLIRHSSADERKVAASPLKLIACRAT